MKKIIGLLFCAIIINILFSGCFIKDIPKREIAVLMEGTLLMDGGYNQGIWEGTKEFAESKGISCQYYQPANSFDATDNDRIGAMRQAIQNGGKILIAVSYSYAKALEVVAKENPDVKFVFVDGWTMGLDNVTAITYKEEESGYMVGYAVVKEGYTKLGGTFGGGGTSPACNKYGYGFLQGVKDASNEDKKNVEVRYSYKYGEGFVGSSELQAQMSSWYVDGVEAIFACGGSMFQSVKSAAEETMNGKIIGVDMDQSKESERVIISAIKNLKASIKKILGEYYNGEWDIKLKNKVSNLGAKDEATGISIESAKFTNFTSEKYDELFYNLKSGKVIVKIDMPNDCNNADWFEKFLGNDSYLKIVFEK